MESVYDKRILLVDDEPDITSLVETALRKEGFRCVDMAFTGKEALAACKENAPDVVILDIMLPGWAGAWADCPGVWYSFVSGRKRREDHQQGPAL